MTGIAPSALINEEDSMIRALETQAEELSWGHAEEILALIAELMHGQQIITARAAGAKSTPKQLKVPRPYDRKAEPVGFRSFMAISGVK